jgi:hypothetical protein
MRSSAAGAKAIASDRCEKNRKERFRGEMKHHPGTLPSLPVTRMMHAGAFTSGASIVGNSVSESLTRCSCFIQPSIPDDTSSFGSPLSSPALMKSKSNIDAHAYAPT